MLVSHAIQIGADKSSVSPCSFGVPQGSVLGPILFAVYVSPMAKIAAFHGTQQQQYADDTQLYIFLSSTSLTAQLSNLQSCIVSIQSWCIHNGLALNPTKTDAVCLGTSGRIASLGGPPILTMSGSSIHPSADIKLLGVTLDSNLTFNKHVTNVCQSAFYHIRAFRHIRHFLDDETAKTVAVAVVGSRLGLDYANAVLYGAPAVHIQRLQRLQNALARVVLRTGRSCSATDCLFKLHWLPIKSRIQFKMALLVKQSQLRTAPVYMSSLLVNYQPTRTLRSCNENLLTLSRTKTVLGARAFRVAGPSVWNSLPRDIRSEDLSESLFKSHLKTVLFTAAFHVGH